MGDVLLILLGMLIGHFLWAPDYSFKVYGGMERIKALVAKIKN